MYNRVIKLKLSIRKLIFDTQNTVWILLFILKNLYRQLYIDYVQ
jgi:hypothetical protein